MLVDKRWPDARETDRNRVAARSAPQTPPRTDDRRWSTGGGPMRVRVKICGVNSIAALEAAVKHHADAVGFVFAESPRNVSLAKARELRSAIPPFVSSVAVFKDPEAELVRTVVEHLRPDLVQAEPNAHVIEFVKQSGIGFLPVLHDDGMVETQVNVLAASGVRYAGVLLEAAGRGGRGVAPDWRVAARLAQRTKLVLAGGLTPQNVGEAVRQVRPFAIDVSSGVESAPGVKDPRLIAAFLRAADGITHDVDRSMEVTR